jgi:glutamate-1-semialdehyde 2,1-aminomutase
MFSFFFTKQPEVLNYDQVQACSADLFRRFYRGLLEAGIYPPPSAYESWFLSTAHGAFEIEKTLDAVELALKALKARR